MNPWFCFDHLSRPTIASSYQFATVLGSHLHHGIPGKMIVEILVLSRLLLDPIYFSISPEHKWVSQKNLWDSVEALVEEHGNAQGTLLENIDFPICVTVGSRISIA